MKELTGKDKADAWRNHLQFLVANDEDEEQVEAIVAKVREARLVDGVFTLCLSVGGEEMYLHLGPAEESDSNIPGLKELSSVHGWLVLGEEEKPERFGAEDARITFLGCIKGELVGSDYYESFDEADTEQWVAAIECAGGENGYVAWNAKDRKWSHLDAETLDEPDTLGVNDDVRRILVHLLAAIASKEHYLHRLR